MSTPTPIELGWAIRRLRKSRKLTIEDLALMADMHLTYLSGIERGLRNPSWVKLASLAEALDLQVSDIVTTAERIHCPMCGTASRSP
jgi:transcriptional regulator with XRE-family HTH domain